MRRLICRIPAVLRAHVAHPYMSLLVLVLGVTCIVESIYLYVAVDDGYASLALLGCRIICVIAFALTPEWAAYAVCGMGALEMMSDIQTPFSTLVLSFLAISIMSYMRM